MGKLRLIGRGVVKFLALLLVLSAPQLPFPGPAGASTWAGAVITSVAGGNLRWTPPVHVDRSGGFMSVSCTPDGPATFCAATDDMSNVFVTRDDRHATKTYLGQAGKYVDLVSVSCVSPSFCAAVDYEGYASFYKGTSWSGPSPTGIGQVAAVSCTSETFCMAVGNNSLGYDVAIFSGKTWRWGGPVDIVDGDLTAVSCASPSFCVAFDVSSVYTWDGSQWGTGQFVDPGGPVNSVSCVSADFCAEVDSAGHALTWDGSSWSTPVAIVGDGQLESVSCLSPSFCTTVGWGHSITGGYSEYNVSTWTAPQIIDKKAFLDGVSCTSTSNCVAVDADGDVLLGT